MGIVRVEIDRLPAEEISLIATGLPSQISFTT